MAGEGFGELMIANVRFRTDPREYTPLTWPRRHSVHPVIGGGVMIQDFGVHPKDIKLTLKSGQEWKLDKDTVAALHRLFRAPNPTYTLSDWLDNEFTVFMARYDPLPSEPHLFTYELDLHVVA